MQKPQSCSKLVDAQIEETESRYGTCSGNNEFKMDGGSHLLLENFISIKVGMKLRHNLFTDKPAENL